MEGKRLLIEDVACELSAVAGEEFHGGLSLWHVAAAVVCLDLMPRDEIEALCRELAAGKADRQFAYNALHAVLVEGVEKIHGELLTLRDAMKRLSVAQGFSPGEEAENVEHPTTEGATTEGPTNVVIAGAGPLVDGAADDGLQVDVTGDPIADCGCAMCQAKRAGKAMLLPVMTVVDAKRAVHQAIQLARKSVIDTACGDGGRRIKGLSALFAKGA